MARGSKWLVAQNGGLRYWGVCNQVDAVKWVERAQSLQSRVTSSLEVAKETLTPHAKTAGEVASVEVCTVGYRELFPKTQKKISKI